MCKIKWKLSLHNTLAKRGGLSLALFLEDFGQNIWD
jgi:hypothetical protein